MEETKSSFENEGYYFSSMKRIFQGIVVEAVAFDRQNTDPLTTKEILIGTNKGSQLCVIPTARSRKDL
jgi:hypothetical protein